MPCERGTVGGLLMRCSRRPLFQVSAQNSVDCFSSFGTDHIMPVLLCLHRNVMNSWHWCVLGLGGLRKYLNTHVYSEGCTWPLLMEGSGSCGILLFLHRTCEMIASPLTYLCFGTLKRRWSLKFTWSKLQILEFSGALLCIRLFSRVKHSTRVYEMRRGEARLCRASSVSWWQSLTRSSRKRLPSLSFLRSCANSLQSYFGICPPSACNSKGGTVHSGVIKQWKAIILWQLFAYWFLSVQHLLDNGLVFGCAVVWYSPLDCVWGGVGVAALFNDLSVLLFTLLPKLFFFGQDFFKTFMKGILKGV